MYFLPDQDLKIEWVRKDENCPREGHTWYGSRYCYFEIDQSERDAPTDDCAVYVLYSMTGETLVNELARRKASELKAGPNSESDWEFERLMNGEVSHRSEEMQFIGRFIMRAGQSAWDESDSASAKSTWMRLASMAPTWRFGFGRRKIDVNRDPIRFAKDGAEAQETSEPAGRARKVQS
ncbi:MAG: hypothetical protein AB7F41_06915 [Methylocystis sp.]|uniref:hypothetical protein n=1 Tax=Methylocystis sp. TaxID=1911079 RepID=UPI003D0C05EC